VDSQLLLCSPIPQSRRAASPYCNPKIPLCSWNKIEDLSSQRKLSPVYLLLTSMVGRIYECFTLLFIAIFLLDIPHYLSSMASSGKPSGPGQLANDPYLCDVCGRAFPTKEEYDTHRLQH
jgi:hypothetical protein